MDTQKCVKLEIAKTTTNSQLINCSTTINKRMNTNGKKPNVGLLEVIRAKVRVGAQVIHRGLGAKGPKLGLRVKAGLREGGNLVIKLTMKVDLRPLVKQWVAVRAIQHLRSQAILEL